MNKSIKKVSKMLLAAMLLSAIIITLSSCSSSNDEPNGDNLNSDSGMSSNKSTEETSSQDTPSSSTSHQDTSSEIHSSSQISSKTQSQKTSSATGKTSSKKASSTASKETQSAKPVISSKPVTSKPTLPSKPTPSTPSKPISSGDEYTVKTGNSTVTVYLNSDSDKATEMFNIINKEREAAGVNPLTINSSLATPALQRTAEITVSWGHTRPDGTEWHTVSDQANGENIASGYTSASSAMEGFMNSAGHRQNILQANFNSVSVACGVSDGKYYWVQLFSNN